MKSIKTHFETLSANDIIPGMFIDGNLVLQHDHSHITFAFTEERARDFPQLSTISVIKAHRKKGLTVEIPEWEVGDTFIHEHGERWQIDSINANIYFFEISGRTNRVRKDIIEIEHHLREGIFWIERDSII